jgi:hypothetical protein
MVVNHPRQAQSGLHKIISAIDASVGRWLGSASNATASDSTLARPTQISVKAAAYAWRHFAELMEALPADQAVPLWQTAQAQATNALELEFAKSSPVYVTVA